jgi:hypothetical protein
MDAVMFGAHDLTSFYNAPAKKEGAASSAAPPGSALSRN